MLYDLVIDGQARKVVGHFGRNGFFYSLDRTNGSFIKASQYANELTWTKGLDPKTGKPVEYNPSIAMQTYIPSTRTLRGDGDERTCPTWHGGVAHQPTAYNPVKKIAYGVGAEGCFTQNGAATAARGPGGGIDNAKSQPRKYSSDLYYGSVMAYDVVNHKVLAKAITDIEVRSGATVTAGGLVMSAMQDGDFIIYDDEQLQELYRFNLGTPLKGAPVTYAIGPKQYIAVQTSGRHLHPVKFDKLETSSYLFVFALN
jgi:alcohol dehydrogenase (cytochrome c)